MALHAGALQIFENNVGVSDAVLLDPVTEEAFIKNIQDRFQHQQIYVSRRGLPPSLMLLVPLCVWMCWGGGG